MIRRGEHTQTLKAATEVYTTRPEFIDRVVTPSVFNPSVYSLKDDNQTVFIAGGEQGMVDFTFYDNSKLPYKEVQKIPVATSGFQCGMLVEDKRSEETKQDSFLLAALF